MKVRRKLHLVRRNPGRQVVADAAPRVAAMQAGRIPRVSRLMALAIHFDRMIREGKVTDQSELALVDASGYSNTRAIGNVLYTDYLYAFEIAAVVLVLAMVTAIVLTMKKPVNTKRQNPGDQVKVKRKDRIRLVKMEAEPVNSKTGNAKSDDAKKGGGE